MNIEQLEQVVSLVNKHSIVQELKKSAIMMPEWTKNIGTSLYLPFSKALNRKQICGRMSMGSTNTKALFI